MAEAMFFLEPDKLDKLFSKIKDNPKITGKEGKEIAYKGIVLCPSIDQMGRPVMFLNPLYGPEGSAGADDVIFQDIDSTACPYPPGYTFQ